MYIYTYIHNPFSNNYSQPKVVEKLGNARCSQSTISFNVIKKQGEHQHRYQLKDCENTQNI